MSASRDLCVSAIRQYSRRGVPAIAVSYLESLSGGAWSEVPGFREAVKDAAWRQHGIEMVYVYERPTDPHWALLPTPEIRKAAIYMRLGAMEEEFVRVQQRRAEADPMLELLLGQLRLVRTWVGSPDPARQHDPVLMFIDT